MSFAFEVTLDLICSQINVTYANYLISLISGLP